MSREIVGEFVCREGGAYLRCHWIYRGGCLVLFRDIKGFVSCEVKMKLELPRFDFGISRRKSGDSK